VLGRVARTRKFKPALPKICSASKRSFPTTSGTFTSELRNERYTVVAIPKRKAIAMPITMPIRRSADKVPLTKLTELLFHLSRNYNDRPGVQSKVRSLTFDTTGSKEDISKNTY
jgi:hypothetical protein